jgi:acetyl esterase
MPLDPFLAALLEQLPTSSTAIDDFEGYRASKRRLYDEMAREFMEPGPDIADVRLVELPVAGGEITVRVYRPVSPGLLPLHIYLHGGAWISGSIFERSTDVMCRERAALAQQVVVAVNYRKAPENQFPAAVEDCHAALLWAVEHAAELGARADAVSIGGASAGANLAAATALKVRDEGGPHLGLMLLEVPATDLAGEYESHRLFGTGYALSSDAMRAAIRAYVSTPADRVHPYASPLRAPELSGLPRTHIMVAEYDILRDEGLAFAERLAEAGVEVSHSLGAGHVHMSFGLTAALPAARAWRKELLTVLRDFGSA